MIWEAIAGGIKGLGDTILGFVREFHMDPKDAAELEQKVRQSLMDHQRMIWELEAKDRDSARQREVATGDPTTRRLAYLYTAGYFGIFVAMIGGYFRPEPDIKQLVDVLMAVLTAGQYSILAYYFGSSHSSQKKDETIDKAMTMP
jgi:hypothetical protein